MPDLGLPLRSWARQDVLLLDWGHSGRKFGAKSERSWDGGINTTSSVNVAGECTYIPRTIFFSKQFVRFPM